MLVNRSFIFGGCRGLSLSLTNELASSDSYVTVFTREQQHSNGRAQSYNYIDIDNISSIDNALSNIPQSLCAQSLDKLDVYLLYGGGLGVNSLCYEAGYQAYIRVFNHNVFIQHKITSYFINQIQPIISNAPLNFIYIFSAVSKHYSADPLYVASKLALEGMMKAFVCMRKPNVTFSGFRLGMVDVDYKYFHRLSTEDPVAFKQILDENLPSQYFPSIDEVAKFMVQATTNSFLTNGMIFDISGGNSWFVK